MDLFVVTLEIVVGSYELDLVDIRVMGAFTSEDKAIAAIDKIIEDRVLIKDVNVKTLDRSDFEITPVRLDEIYYRKG